VKLDRYGYGQCYRCKTLRPEKELREVPISLLSGGDAVVCSDAAFCSRAADVGKGELDGGAPRGPELNEEVDHVQV
jgi:hypothetical protein